MGDLRIRNFDENAKSILRERASREGTTLEALASTLLIEAAFAKRRKMAGEASKMRQQLFEKYGLFEDSTIGIREDRDTRG